MDKNAWIGLGVGVLTLLFIFFDQAQKSSPVDTLNAETMRIHDESMKAMAEMNRIGRVLKAELTGLDSLGLRADSIRSALNAMRSAEEDMYTWMREYRAPDKLPAKEAEQYLTDQKQKIEQNQKAMQGALELGKKLAH